MSNHTFNQLTSQTSLLSSINKSLEAIETDIETANTHHSNNTQNLTDLETLVGTSNTKLNNIQTITDTKLSAIQNFLDKDHAQFHLKHHPDDHHLMIAGNTSADGSGTKNHAHVDGNGVLKVSQVSSQNIDPANTSNADHASHSKSFAVGIRGRSNITDETTGKFLQCNTSGQLNCNVVNSVNVEVHGHTDISDTNSSVRLLGNASGHLIVSDAPTTYENVTLSNPNNILALTGGDSIDMNGFRNIFISCVISATTGGTCNSIFLLGSNDNSTFVITSDSFQPTEARSNGTYESGAVFGNLGYRYLKLASNNSSFVASVSSVVIKTNRFNGSF